MYRNDKQHELIVKGTCMNVKKVGFFLTAALMAATAAHASEADILANLLAEKGVITFGEAQQVVTETNETSRALVAQGKQSTLPQWIQNISMKGDLRLRHQVDWSSTNNRERERLRLRTGFETRIADNLKAGFGLATGSEKNSDTSISVSSSTHKGTASGTGIIDAEPTSTNHTFSNGFAKAMLMVDYAYLEYAPYAWMTVTGGKMKSGTQLWQTTDLQWDTDINPDGVAVNLSKDFGPVKSFVNASWLIFNELNDATKNNPDMTIVQPGVSFNFTPMIAFKGALAFEQMNVNGKNTGYYGTPSFDYNIMAPSVQIAFKEIFMGYSVSMFGDMVTNNDDKATKDTAGSAYGIQFGHEKVAEWGTWQGKFISRRLEQNAWLNKLGDSDSYGGAVNAEGFEAIVTLGLTKAASLALDYYSMDAINGATSKTPKTLLQCDLVYKF